MFLVGTIVSTHGIKGEVKVKSDTSFERFKVNATLYLKKDNKEIPIIINSHRVHNGLDLITFNNLNDINDVLPYINCSLYALHNNDELEDGEFYYEDIIGLIAYDQENNLIGEIVDLREVPQGLILEINYKNKIVLVPFVDEYVMNIDIENKKIMIMVIEGLI